MAGDVFGLLAHGHQVIVATSADGFAAFFTDHYTERPDAFGLFHERVGRDPGPAMAAKTPALAALGTYRRAMVQAARE